MKNQLRQNLKTRPSHYLYLLLIITATLSGCVSSGSTLIPIKTKTQTPSSIPILPTSTPTFIPTETATLTPLATLESEQARETIKTLLQEPVDCEAPCFWGIMPGQTTLSVAQNIFTYLGLPLEYTNTLADKEFYEGNYDFDTGLSVKPLLATQDDIIKNLTIYITPEKQKAGVPREWSAYSPETLINRYGSPSRVGFVLDWGPRSYFEMDVYFDEFDLVVEYTGHDIIPRQKGSPQVCPLTDQYDSVRLWMGKDPYQPPPADTVSLEKATSMKMEEFSKLMIGDLNNACFTLKGDVFP